MSRYLNSKKVINNSKCMVNNMSNRSIECKPTINSLYQTSLICDYVPNCEDVVEQARITEYENEQRRQCNEKKVELFRQEVKKRVRKIQTIKRIKNETREKAISAEQTQFIRKATQSADVMLGIVNAHPSHHIIKTKCPLSQGAIDANKATKLTYQTHEDMIRRRTEKARNDLFHATKPESPPQSPCSVNSYPIDCQLNIETSKDKEVLIIREFDNDTAESINNKANDKRKKRPKSVLNISHITGTTRLVDVNPGAVDAASRRAVQTQRAMYRRHFMDIERNQIKDAVEKADERKRVEILKRDKEKERQELESMTTQFAKVQQFEPIQPCPEEQRLLAFEKDRIDKLEKMKTKKIENKRYVEAMVIELKKKAHLDGVDLPPLCACWDDIWAMDPDRCANNCMFYRNPKEYASALKTMLMSFI